MNVDPKQVVSTCPSMGKCVVLKAEPEPLEIDLRRLVVMIIDMQNAFVSKGGMFDLWGANISRCLEVIAPIKKVVGEARSKRVRVIYVAHRLPPDLCDIGPSSPFYHKGILASYRNEPQMRDKLIIRGTWGAEIVDELKPHEGDMLVEKQRYSAFAGTNMDMILKTYDIKYIAFTGVATNVCVESSLRDAMHREYFPILISDAAGAVSQAVQAMTIDFVKECFGWVTTSDNLIEAMR